jgi:DNA-binding MarR family transcriptional regulator
VTDGLERELSLLARHIMPGRRPSSAEQLDRSAYLLLQRLEDQGPMSIGELAEAFDLDPSTINRQTAALLRQQFADRVPDPSGGIARKLRITKEGARQLRDDRQYRREGIREIVKDWTPDEIDRFEHDLRRFNERVEQAQQRPWPRPEP